MKARYAQQSLAGTPARVANTVNVSVRLENMRRTLMVWRQRAARRESLRQHLLHTDVQRIEKDIGVESGTLAAEARKPFWRE